MPCGKGGGCGRETRKMQQRTRKGDHKSKGQKGGRETTDLKEAAKSENDLIIETHVSFPSNKPYLCGRYEKKCYNKSIV